MILDLMLEKEYEMPIKEPGQPSMGNYVTKSFCNCVAFKPPQWYYWFELLLHNWTILIVFMVAFILLLFIIRSSLFESTLSNEPEKCPPYEDLIEVPNFKVDNEAIKSTGNPTLSSIVVKY